MRRLQESLQDFFIDHGVQKTYWIAYSGGVDSHVLLHLCQRLRSQFPINLMVLHINHGFSANANKWTEHCQKICKQYKLPFIERKIRIEEIKGLSLEEEARKKRHAIFAEYLNEEDILLTAHHEDDQAETLLLQLMRGAGPKGLASMPLCKPFGKGFHARPLLHFSRAHLRQYAQEHSLSWIDDESNDNQKLTRNFLRHEVLPQLKKRWSNIANTLSRVAEHCADAEFLLREYALKLYEEVKGSEANTLSVAKLKELDSKKQCLILRTWIDMNGYLLPSQKKLASIQQNILYAGVDRMPSVAWSDVSIRRYRDHLYLLKDCLEGDLDPIDHWDLGQDSLHLSNQFKLKVITAMGEGLALNINPISIRFRKGGERLSFSKRPSRTIKNLFQEWNVLPWERERVPLIFFEEKLIGVVGYFLDERFKARANELGRHIILERNITD